MVAALPPTAPMAPGLPDACPAPHSRQLDQAPKERHDHHRFPYHHRRPSAECHRSVPSEAQRGNPDRSGRLVVAADCCRRVGGAVFPVRPSGAGAEPGTRDELDGVGGFAVYGDSGQAESGGRQFTPTQRPTIAECTTTRADTAPEVAGEPVAQARPTRTDRAQQPDGGVRTTGHGDQLTGRGRPATGLIDGLIGHLLDLDITGSHSTNHP